MKLLDLVVEKTMQQMNQFFKKKELEELLEEYAIDSDSKAKEKTEAELKRQIQENPDHPYVRLRSKLHAELSMKVLDLCISAFIYPDLENWIKTQYEYGITLELVSGMYDYKLTDSRVRIAYEEISKYLYCDASDIPYFRYPFFADEYIFTYLSGEVRLDKRLMAEGAEVFDCSSEEEVLYHNEKALEKLEVCLKLADTPKIIQIAGSPGGGRRFLLKKACERRHHKLLLIDSERIFTKSLAERKRLLWIIVREALFTQAAVAFYHIKLMMMETQDSFNRWIRDELAAFAKQVSILFLLTDKEVDLIPYSSHYIHKIELESAGRNERIRIWEGFAGNYNIKEQMDILMTSVKYKLSVKEIALAAMSLKMIYDTTGQIAESDISEVCYAVLPTPQQGVVRRISISSTLDDLKLPASQKQVLMHIISHIRYRHRVFDEWGLEKKYTYGKNVSALFVGAPGTGKTMAAHVLSGMLHIPIYRVDLSQVVDKYIGETEKKLEEIFQMAEKSNTILFFDEADSIFGKRSEVNDAKDKYANTEVSYILQRIEEYEGIVILASNFRKNIDEAFLRRIRYLVEFPFPSIETRRDIWQSCFTDEIPTQDLDFDFLASNFEIAGGSIKNIMLNAFFHAAEAGHSVGMKDILNSIKIENQKMGKILMPKDFNEYEHLF